MAKPAGALIPRGPPAGQSLPTGGPVTAYLVDTNKRGDVAIQSPSNIVRQPVALC